VRKTTLFITSRRPVSVYALVGHEWKTEKYNSVPFPGHHKGFAERLSCPRYCAVLCVLLCRLRWSLRAEQSRAGAVVAQQCRSGSRRLCFVLYLLYVWIFIFNFATDVHFYNLWKLMFRKKTYLIFFKRHLCSCVICSQVCYFKVLLLFKCSPYRI